MSSINPATSSLMTAFAFRNALIVIPKVGQLLMNMLYLPIPAATALPM
jgi:hypothetical protein